MAADGESEGPQDHEQDRSSLIAHFQVRFYSHEVFYPQFWRLKFVAQGCINNIYNSIPSTQEITGIDDHAKVVQLLSARHWELEAAVHDAFNEKEGVPSVFAPDPPLPSGPQPGLRRRPMTSQAPGQAGSVVDAPPSATAHGDGRRSRNGAVVAQRQQNWWEWIVNVAIFPLRFVLNAASDLLQFVSKSPKCYVPPDCMGVTTYHYTCSKS